MKWEEISWILRGKIKKEVLLALDKPKTATSLSKELDTHRSTISDILIQMEKNKIIECLDPKQPYNRFYKRLKKGDEIVKEIEKM